LKLTRGKREVDDVSDCGDKNRCAFIASGYRIRIRLLVRTDILITSWSTTPVCCRLLC